MPIYEYECGACGERAEFIQKFSEGPKKKCPECGKLALKKLISAAAFHLKGDGWYVTDFRDKDNKKDGKDAGDKKTSEKADSKETKSSSKDDSKKAKTSDGESKAKKPDKKKESKPKSSD